MQDINSPLHNNTAQRTGSPIPCSQEVKRNRGSRRRNSRQAMLLDPDRQDSMTEDGEGRSRGESMLDVARGLSASLQNIRRSGRLQIAT